MIIMIKYRYYIDNQKEQDWLNKLSREGWALKKFFLGFYKFEKCEPGEYESNRFNARKCRTTRLL